MTNAELPVVDAKPACQVDPETVGIPVVLDMENKPIFMHNTVCMVNGNLGERCIMTPGIGQKQGPGKRQANSRWLVSKGERDLDARKHVNWRFVVKGLIIVARKDMVVPLRWQISQCDKYLAVCIVWCMTGKDAAIYFRSVDQDRHGRRRPSRGS